VIVTGANHLGHVEEQLGFAPDAEVIVEPSARNTAAIALAALRLPPERVMLVCPSDHYIGRVEAFVEAARAAGGWRKAAGWWPLASPPPRPKPALAISAGANRSTAAAVIDRFVEKPDLERARWPFWPRAPMRGTGHLRLPRGRFLKELGAPARHPGRVQGGGGWPRGCAPFPPEPAAFAAVQSDRWIMP
jgi:hypothetical protein